MTKNGHDDSTGNDVWSPDELIEALHALDPAAGHCTDLGSLRAAVDATMARSTEDHGVMPSRDDGAVSSRDDGALPGAGGPATRESAAAESADGGLVLTLEPHRRRWRSAPWKAVAAVSVGVLAVGAGGYGLGAARPSGHEVVTSAASRMVEPAVTHAAAGGTQRESGASDSVAATEVFQSGSAAAARTSGLTATANQGASSAQADLAAAWSQGHFAFTDGGLVTEATTAEGWGVDASGVYSSTAVASLAKVFGVPGKPQEVTDGTSVWSVTAGKDQSQRVSLDKSGRFDFSDYADEEGSAKGQEKKAAISDRKAVKKVTAVLTDLGLDATQWTVSLDTDYGMAADERGASSEDAYVSVTASEVLRGKASGRAWSFSFYGDTLQWADGTLAPAISLGEYSVVSPAAAMARLSDPRFGSSQWPVSYPAAVQQYWESDGDDAFALAGGSVPPTPAAGDKLDWPTAGVTFTSARLGLSVYTQSDGATLMLPTYELSAANGAAWSVIAISDDSLETGL